MHVAGSSQFRYSTPLESVSEAGSSEADSPGRADWLTKGDSMFTRAILPAFIGLFLVAAMPAHEAKQESGKLQGEWNIVSSESKGRKSPDEFLTTEYKLTITGDKFTTGIPGVKEAKWTFKIDASKDPKTIDLTATFK